MATILLISADRRVCDALRGALAAQGHLVTDAASRDEGLRALHTLRADLVALDLAGPGLPVEQFCRWLWADPDRAHVPILFMGPRAALQVDGALPSVLRPGVDGYLGRPFDAEGLAETVAGLLSGGDSDPAGQACALRAGLLSLDPVRRSLRWAGPPEGRQDRQVRLTPIECRLLQELMERPGLAVSAEELLAKVWGYHPGTGGDEVLRAHVRNLRRKLRHVREDAELLETVPRVGYRLAVRESD